MSVVLDTAPPLNAPLSAKYKRSFAYPSMNDRCPVIISKIVDHLYREKLSIGEQYGEEAKEEIKAVIGDLSRLRNHLQTNKPFEYFSSSDPDTDTWNDHMKKLEERGVKLNYYDADWLFAECYLYRHIREIFAVRKKINNFDPFKRSKTELLFHSLPTLRILLKHQDEVKLLDSSVSFSSGDLRRELNLLLQRSLWANRLDLSISVGEMKAYENYFVELQKLENNVIANDSDKFLDLIFSDNNKGADKRIDIIVDNAGLEILCDFCLADFLITRCGISKVKFHVKHIPWYVSDTTENDIKQILETLESPLDAVCQKYGARWRTFFESGRWSVSSDTFWCSGYSYSEMATVRPSLYQELRSASCLLFKGDLNYRKLDQDINWDPVTPFRSALGHFLPAPVLAMRSVKADTICGLKPGQAEALFAKDKDWMITGTYAVVQFAQPDK